MLNWFLAHYRRVKEWRRKARQAYFAKRAQEKKEQDEMFDRAMKKLEEELATEEGRKIFGQISVQQVTIRGTRITEAIYRPKPEQKWGKALRLRLRTFSEKARGVFRRIFPK